MRFLIAISVLTILFSSCSQKSCDDEVQCTPLNDTILTMTPFLEGESITFINKMNEEIIFVVEDTFRTKEWKEPCFYNDEVNDCECYTCLPESKYTSYTSDTTRQIIDNGKVINLRKLEFSITNPAYDRGTEYNASFHLFNFKRENIQFSPLTLNANEDFIESIQFGDSTYYNVIVVYADTTQAGNLNDPLNPYASKVFFNSDAGIIAFRDLLTGSTFYLK